jgi:antitoxin HigA-1
MLYGRPGVFEAGRLAIRMVGLRKPVNFPRQNSAGLIEAMAQRRKLPPIPPGELLKDELQELNLSLNELSRALRVPMNRISAIVNGRRAITVDTAIRLARYFGTSPQYWLNLQNAYDLESADRKAIEKQVLPRNAA